MFNEIMEYYDYTDIDLVNFDNNWGGINFTTDYDKDSIANVKPVGTFNGLERVLTIIARYRLFEVYKYNEFETSEISSLGYTQSETIDIVKKELMAWFGFTDEETSFDAKGWFKYYYDNYANYPVSINDKGTGAKIPSIKNVGKPIRLKPEIFMPTEKSSAGYLINVPAILRSEAKLIMPWDQILSQKANGFSKKLFTTKPDDRNTFKVVSYEKTIASAINLGGLNTFYLIAKDSFIHDLKFLKGTKDKRYVPVDIKKDIKKIDYFLKYLGVYLIEQRYTNKQNVILLNVSDFSLWVGTDLTKHGEKYKDAKGNEIIYKIDFNDNSSGKSGSNVRINTIAPAYLMKHGFRIVEKSEIIIEILNSDNFSSKYQPDMAEDDLLKLYLEIINKDVDDADTKYSIYSDGGFGNLLNKIY